MGRRGSENDFSDLIVFLPEGTNDRTTTNKDSIIMESRSNRLRSVIGICVLLALTGIVYLGYFCPDHVCALTNNRDSDKDSIRLPDNFIQVTLPTSTIDIYKNLLSNNPSSSSLLQSSLSSSSSSSLYHHINNVGYDDILQNETFKFDINAHDVMVFLHIQKTGGTLFGKHLVRDLDLARPCSCQRRKKRCFCYRPNRDENWLFSRYSTGWKCGLHADWTELTNCVDFELNKIEDSNIKRRYFYVTIIREPVSRYLSEFRHVQRGATWKGARHWCAGTMANIPQCYSGPYWKGVTLDDFMACKNNLATNRQTRMLADLSLIGCYNSSLSSTERDNILLESAKRNLQFMPFVMLTEYQKMGQYTFEETFDMRFAIAFEQHNSTLSAATIATLKPKKVKEIKKLNYLDEQLYSFARELVFKRFNQLKDRDPSFDQRFHHLGELSSRQSATEFNWDSVIEDTTDND